MNEKTENMEEKRKFALWAKDSTLQMAKKLYKEDNCKSQSEFIEKAIIFYAGMYHQIRTMCICRM